MAVTALGALGGQVLARFLPQSVLRTVAALAFLVMGLVVGWEAIKVGRTGQGQVDCASPDDTGVDCEPERGWDWRAFGATFGLLFVAELGDKTQLAVLSLVGRYSSPWMVFLGGSLALTAVTALGVLGGEGLCRLIPEKVLLWASAVAFVLMGALMGVGVL
jgi:putative Ca2+/H+ antiporter (TMEM165/GDT1 family)